MSKVKPTRIVTPRIIQPRSGGWTWLWLAFLAAFSFWTWQVYEFGQQRGGYSATQRDAAEDALLARIDDLEKQKIALTARAARYERAGQIDRAAAEEVKAEVRELQEERAALKREVAFLTSLVSGGGTEELLLDAPRLVETGERSFRFEVTLKKRSEDSNTVSGRVLIKVLGKAGDKQQRLEMTEFTDGKRSNIGIRFKNFQKLKTDLKLPEGFDPIKIEVAVQPTGNQFKSLEQAYDWKLSDA
jgi:hypothetical protein